MTNPCPLVRVDSKHHFQYVGDCIPANRAVVQLLRHTADGKVTPTGVILVYRLLTADDADGELKTEVLDSLTSVASPSEALVEHARACILPMLDNPGNMTQVSFIGKAFNTAERRWQTSGYHPVIRGA